MNDFLNAVSNILHYWIFISLILAIPVLFIWLYLKLGVHNPKNLFFNWSLGLLVQLIFSIILFFVAEFILTSHIKIEFHERLKSSDLIIFCNGLKLSDDSSKIIAAELDKMQFVGDHHSDHVGKEDFILISKKDSMKIRLSEDTQIKNEYWIFCSDYSSIADDDIGRIHPSKEIFHPQ
ncbi:MAG: hypothetical protein WCI97_07585 [Bacteroidota bacterium]